MENEEWRPIPGWEGRYEVSTLGRVRSLPRTYRATFGLVTTKIRVLRPSEEKNGYRSIHLNPGNVRKSIHSVVAEAFYGPRPPGHDILHLNGNRADNRLENLRYGTRSENHRDCYNYGSRQGPGKLYREQVFEIRKLLAQGVMQKEIAAKYGVNPSAIRDIKSGAHFGYLQNTKEEKHE